MVLGRLKIQPPGMTVLSDDDVVPLDVPYHQTREMETPEVVRELCDEFRWNDVPDGRSARGERPLPALCAGAVADAHRRARFDQLFTEKPAWQVRQDERGLLEIDIQDCRYPHAQSPQPMKCRQF